MFAQPILSCVQELECRVGKESGAWFFISDRWDRTNGCIAIDALAAPYQPWVAPAMCCLRHSVEMQLLHLDFSFTSGTIWVVLIRHFCFVCTKILARSHYSFLFMYLFFTPVKATLDNVFSCWQDHWRIITRLFVGSGLSWVSGTISSGGWLEVLGCVWQWGYGLQRLPLGGTSFMLTIGSYVYAILQYLCAQLAL